MDCMSISFFHVRVPRRGDHTGEYGRSFSLITRGISKEGLNPCGLHPGGVLSHYRFCGRTD